MILLVLPPTLTPCLTLSSWFLSTVRERQEEQEKEEEEEKEWSSSKSSSKSDWNEWKSEQASGKMLEEGPNHVTALQNRTKNLIKQGSV